MKSFTQFLIEQSQQQDYVRPLYHALVSAEHRGVVKDPTKFDPKLYIRTRYQPKGSVSTAYGPGQLTVSTVEDTLKRHKDLIDPQHLEYVTAFVEQGRKMKTADPKDPTYGYGCVGDLCDEKYQEPYESLATSVIKAKLKDANIAIDKPLSADDLTKATERWRGQPEKDDPEYFKIVREKYGTGVSTITTPEQPKLPTPVKPETTQSDQSQYVIKPGDTFWKLGGNTSEGAKKLQELNPGVDPTKLKPGQTIKTR